MPIRGLHLSPLVGAERIVLEEAATNTWENLTLAVPLVEAFDTIVIASDPAYELAIVARDRLRYGNGGPWPASSARRGPACQPA
ncbi:MAG TPA: hypothetical protein VGR74_11315 [Actinomycetota bacterium]|jgi:hypothetical protein|nr:hypothetical protein [Actinomycetota bacterium]